MLICREPALGYIPLVSLYNFLDTNVENHSNAIAMNLRFPRGVLYMLLGRYVTAQATTALVAPQEDAHLSTVNDAQGSTSSQTMSSQVSTGQPEATDRTISIRLRVPTPISAATEIEEDLATTTQISRTQIVVLASTSSAAEASETAPLNTSLPRLPAVTAADIEIASNATATHSSVSSPSIVTIEQSATTVYVAQIPTMASSSSSTSEAEATETESFLGRTGITTSGSSANIAAIGIGAGCGAVVLVVVSVIAMWLLHRQRGSRRGAGGHDSKGKLAHEGA